MFSGKFNETVVSVFSFDKSEEATTRFNRSNGDTRKALKLPEYYINIEPVDNEAPVVPSAPVVLSTVDENSRNDELSWMNKVRYMIRKDCNVNKFPDISCTVFIDSNEQQFKKEIVKKSNCTVFYLGSSNTILGEALLSSNINGSRIYKSWRGPEGNS